MLQLPALPTEGEWDMGVALAPHPGVAAIAYGGIHGRQAGLFVTTDGGAHWRQANAASSVAGIERANDWTGWLDVEFDESGRLHLAGQLAGDTTSDLYLTRSPDLGRSWRRAVLVGSNSGNPHLTVAGRRLYLSWGLWEE